MGVPARGAGLEHRGECRVGVGKNFGHVGILEGELVLATRGAGMLDSGPESDTTTNEEQAVQTRTIGTTTVSAIGLGGMPLSIEGRPDDRGRAVATIHAALDAGITLIDTADAYHLHADEVGHNESLIAEAPGHLRRGHLRRPRGHQGRAPATR